MTGISLKAKTTVTVSLLVVGIIAAAAFFFLRYFETHFKQTISNQQFTLVSVVADDFDARIASSHDFIIEAAKKLDVRVLDNRAKAAQFLAGSGDLLKRFDNGIFLFDGAGALIAEAPVNTGRTGKNFSFREYFSVTVASGKPYISKPYVSSQEHGRPAVMFTAPVYDRDRHLVGILAGSLDLVKGGFLAKVRDIRLGKRGYLSIAGADRTIIMHPDPQKILKQAAPGSNKLLDRVIEQNFEGTEESVTTGGWKALTSYKRLQSTDWIVGAHYPVTEAYAPFLQVRKFILLGAAPIAVITILGVMFLMKYLTAPLLLLARHAEELPRKTGADRLCRIRQGGEIGTLVGSFNQMVEELDRQKEALLQSEELYRTLVEFTSDFIFWRSADLTTMAYVSPRCVNFTGYTDTEFYDNARLLDEIVHPADRDEWLNHVTAACGGLPTEALELRLVSKTGEVFWVNHLCRPILSDAGKLLGVRGSFSDISSRKQIEQSQQEQLHLLQTLLDAIPAPVFYKDAQGAYLGCNSSFEAYIGLAKADIVGRTVFQLFPEELARVYYQADADLLQRRGIQCYEAKILFNEGTLRDVMFYKATFTNLQGGLGGLVGTLLDITERNKSEAALRASEEKFRLFFEDSRDAIFVTDGQQSLTNVNNALLELFGYGRDELIGRNICQTFSDHTCTEAMMQELMEKGFVREVEVEVLKKDGTVVICLLSASARFSEGFLLGIQGSLHDITARKQAEEVLIRQNEYLAAMHETTKGLISRLDLNSLLHTVISRAGSLMKTTHSYIYLLDESRNRMVRESSTGIFTDFFDYTIKKGYGLVGKVWQKGEPIAVDDYHAWSGRLPDPAREVLRAMVGVPLTSGEKVIGVIGLAMMEENRKFGGEEIDILTRFAELASLALHNARLYEEAREELHERKRAEEQLRKLSHAVEQSPVSVIITDTTGAIEYVNPKFTETTGYSAAEVQGKNPRFLKSGEIAGAQYENLWQTITSGREWSGEFYNKKKSGELFWELASVSPIRDSAGAITHYIAVKEDITEQKKLENQLRHSQKMDAVGKLAGGIAHDFNNIMTAIIGYATILDMRLDPDGPHGNSVKQILFSAKRATNLTEGLLAFSRKQVSHPRPTRLNDVVRRVEKILERLIGEDIEFTSALTDSTPTVMVDPFQMEQVLINLATNARDAMPAGGKLRIATDVALLDDRFIKSHGLSTRGLHAKLTVSDTGDGMDQSVVKRIFEPFFTTKELGKGTGLGLSIVYGIVEKHGGSISCYSEPGLGTNFTIYFPAIEAAIEETKPEAEARMTGGCETILLAEDDGVVREFTRELLADYGYKVITAVDGEDAVAKFSQNQESIDLLILDLVMPRKNGREAYENIGSIKPGVKVIFSSGYEAETIQKRGTLPEDFHYLAKPVTPALLLAKVREVLDS